MPNVEKVISDLEEQITWIRDNDFHKFPGWGHAVLAMRDALALLKAQEPRVVKISELTSGEPMLVWLEDIDKKEIVAGMIFDYVPGRFGFKLTDIGSMDRIYPRIEDYLTRWRCWTSRPTDEQREATPWIS